MGDYAGQATPDKLTDIENFVVEYWLAKQRRYRGATVKWYRVPQDKVQGTAR